MEFAPFIFGGKREKQERGLFLKIILYSRQVFKPLFSLSLNFENFPDYVPKTERYKKLNFPGIERCILYFVIRT